METYPLRGTEVDCVLASSHVRRSILRFHQVGTGAKTCSELNSLCMQGLQVWMRCAFQEPVIELVCSLGAHTTGDGMVAKEKEKILNKEDKTGRFRERERNTVVCVPNRKVGHSRKSRGRNRILRHNAGPEPLSTSNRCDAPRLRLELCLYTRTDFREIWHVRITS